MSDTNVISLKLKRWARAFMWNLSHWKFARNSYFRGTQSRTKKNGREKKWEKTAKSRAMCMISVRLVLWKKRIFKVHTHNYYHKCIKWIESELNRSRSNRIKSKRNLNALERVRRDRVRTPITVYLFNVFKPYFLMHSQVQGTHVGATS